MAASSQDERLAALLRLVYDPAAPAAGKRAAEGELQALARTDAALEWALHTLTAGTSDNQALFYACTVADAGAAVRWRGLDSRQQAALRACLWRGATDPAQPHFVRSKLAASLAHTACLDWPADFWPGLSACLADPLRLGAGVALLTAMLDHFRSLAQATSFGLRGKVPSSSIPGIQQRYRELQPAALATLCSLLHSLRGSLPAAAASGDSRALSLAAKALHGLRHALSDINRMPEEQGISSAAIAGLLFEFVGAARLAPAGGGLDGEEAALLVAAAAMDCLTDLQANYCCGAEGTAQMLEVLVPRLQDTCALVQQRWAQQGGQFSAEDQLLTPFVRLLAQFFTTQLSNLEAAPHLGATARGILGQVLQLSTARRSPVDLLLFLEVWHAVLTYLDGFEEQLWEVEGDPQAQARMKQAVAAYKEPVLAVADLVLSTLGLAGASTAPPPFALDALGSAPGGGSAMEDWLLAVVAGGDGAREGEQEAAAAAAAEADADSDLEYEDELLVPGTASPAGGSPFAADSEVDVFVRHAESFLGRAIGSFSADMLPRVLLRLQAASAAFAQACHQAAAAVGQSAAGAQAQATLDGLVPAFRAMDVCLRLLTRCAPSFPTSGAAEGVAEPLAAGGGAAGAIAISGAHAAQSMRALFQLSAGWLQSVQAIATAAAAQQAGQPSTPAHPAAAAWSGGLAAMLLAGSRVHKALGSLTATWLSQLVMALVRGSADPEAAPVAQELVQGVLSSAAALLQALTAPQQLAGWQAGLHRGAVWAAESLVSLTSIALSSSLKPPPALLGAVWSSDQVQAQLRPAAQACLGGQLPPALPVKASRALWLSLSDLALRSWPAQPAAQFDLDARAAAFASLAAPLVQLLQQAGAHGCGAEAEAAAVRQAAALAAGIVQSYAGSPKPLRGIVSSALAGRLLNCVTTILHASGGAPGGGRAGAGRGKASAALLRLVAACLEVLASELGSEAVEQLLGALVNIFGAAGGDPSFQSDLIVMGLLATVLSQGSTHKHQSLLMPALHYCLGVWERTAAPQAAASTDADVMHVRAVALATLLSLLRIRWRALAGGGGGDAKCAAGAAAAAGAHPLANAAAAAAAAAAGGQLQQQPGQLGRGDGPGGAVISRVLQLLHDHFAAAGGMGTVLAAADVRLVLEELYELQVATKLYSLPLFQPLRAPLAAALLAMLVSGVYRGAQDELIDSLFSLAAANWSDFHLVLLPRFVEQRLGRVGCAERATLVALFGHSDLQAHAFERQLLFFLSDAAFFERGAA